MIENLNEVGSDPFSGVKYDVCICGAGVAGITIAGKLSSKLRVLLLEAGEFDYTIRSQDVYQGKITGLGYFDLTTTRLRYFGGTSNHWSGWCRPLDAYDFERKPYLSTSGWPITRSDLDPYLSEAREILDIPDTPENNILSDNDCVASTLAATGQYRSIRFWRSAPTRFGQKYRDFINQRSSLDCFLNANITDIVMTDDHSSISHLEIMDYRGNRYRVSATTYILAFGGIENPRILLNANKQNGVGVGNKKDLVGRFFADHPHHTIGSFILTDKSRRDIAANWVDTLAARRFFSPTQEMMHRDSLLNFGIRFQPNKPVLAYSFKERLKSVICDHEFTKNLVNDIRGEELTCYNNENEGILRMSTEQAPNMQSRITLGQETDKFGLRRLNINWQLSDIDLYTIRQAAIGFGEAMAKLDIGRMHVEEWIQDTVTAGSLPGIGEDEVAGHHHMCTTRMGSNPGEGVVNADQRVFGLDNLYIAGSSVFSSTGHANPTFTIVQMSLRLADHINSTLNT